MNLLKKVLLGFFLLFFFWMLLFDGQRIAFIFHNLSKFDSFWETLQVFFYAIRLDLSTASYLTALPFLFFIAFVVFKKNFLWITFQSLLFLELIIVIMIHAGEINAYGEWNHKLTSRVFMHLGNPDEVVRTAEFSMIFWFIFYFIIEFFFGWLLYKWLFKKERFHTNNVNWKWQILILFPISPFLLGFQFLIIRGGWQPIPINIDAAYFSKNYTVNDVAVNSTYFFGKSFLLYKRSNIGEYLSNYSDEELNEIVRPLFNYPKEHDFFVLNNKTPNLVFIILESWTANVIHTITGEQGFTPEFDKLTEDGILFTNFYAIASTSEIGNAGIFSGFPSLPEISISMEPSKHRKLQTINKSLSHKNYTAGYLFSGDLKYGNIGSFFTDHQFERVEDESNFPKNLNRGKLNYFDEDLYQLFLQKINQQHAPFIECAFTGSTHSPYDYPGNKTLNWHGKEENFVNSIIYADQCLGDFMREAKKQDWYKNTLFVLVADHGHASPLCTDPNDSKFYHIPLLLYGEPLKDTVRGMKIDKIGSQIDIPQTLLYQLHVETGNDYPWSVDLFNPKSASFALHSTIRGFGWVSEKGNFTYHLDYQKYLIKNMDKQALSEERKKCDALMQIIYKAYKDLW